MKQSRWIVGLSMLAVAAIAWALYGRALGFGFFNDDPTGHFAWMEGRSVLDYFISSAEYGYYRPVVFATLQTFVNRFDYDARWFHALLLGLHAANSALVWLLAWRLGRNLIFAWFAALMWASMPFSYEAVAYVASLTHPLVTFWALASVLLYQQARTHPGGRRFFYAAAYLALVLALFSHENGLMVPFMLLGIDWLVQPPRSVRNALGRPAIWYFVAPMLFLLLWLTIPKTGAAALPTLSSISRNSLPFLQTLVYPLLPLLKLDSSQAGGLLVTASAVLLATALCATYARKFGVWLFGLAWFTLGSLPAILFLSTDYLYGSPRLSYLPAVGAALMWAMPLLALSAWPARQGWQKGLVVLAQMALLVGVVLPPRQFVRCELDFYATTSDIVREMGRISAEAPANQPIVFVNTPFFFSSTPQHPDGCPSPYAWTPVGAVVVPEYAQTQDFVRFNGGPNRPTSAVVVADYAPGWATMGDPIGLDGVREMVADSAVFVFDLNRTGFFALSQGWQPAQPVAEPQALFGKELGLVESAVGIDDHAVDVHLTWQVVRPSGQPVTSFVHVVGPDGALIAQVDAPPVHGFVPPAIWQAGDQFQDTFSIPLPAPLTPGSRVVVGLYDPMTGERWVASAEGQPLPDNVFTLAQVEPE